MSNTKVALEVMQYHMAQPKAKTGSAAYHRQRRYAELLRSRFNIAYNWADCKCGEVPVKVSP